MKISRELYKIRVWRKGKSCRVFHVESVTASKIDYFRPPPPKIRRFQNYYHTQTTSTDLWKLPQNFEATFSEHRVCMFHIKLRISRERYEVRKSCEGKSCGVFHDESETVAMLIEKRIFAALSSAGRREFGAEPAGCCERKVPGAGEFEVPASRGAGREAAAGDDQQRPVGVPGKAKGPGGATSADRNGEK